MSTKHRILFVCHGNICRSPMAEAVMKKMVHERGLDDEFEIDSAATSLEAIGEDVYHKARIELIKNGINGFSHISRRYRKDDYNHFDRIYVMDSNNMNNILRITEDRDGKIQRLLKNRDIADPWYTDDFDKAFSEIKKGCRDILDELVD